MTVYHKHHIIPKHAGGTNDKANIAKLTVEEHAEAHRVLFEQYGRWQDRVAWQTLSGQISQAEAIKEAQRNGDKTWMKTPEGREIMKAAWKKSMENGRVIWNTNIAEKQPDHPARKIWSENGKKYQKEGKLFCVGDWQKANPVRSDEYRKHLSEAVLALPKKTCIYCGFTTTPPMHGRWHGERCKHKPTSSYQHPQET